MRENVADESECWSGEYKRVQRDKGAANSRNRGDLMLVRIADDPGHTWQSSYLFWSTLRIAACYQDSGVGIRAMDASNSCAGILISGCGDGASVQDNNIGIGSGLRLVQALVGKLSLDGGAIGLSGAAAKVLHIKGRHRAIID